MLEFFVFVALPTLVSAWPNQVGCGRVIEVGETFMNQQAVADTSSRTWVIERGADVVPCGGEYVPGETLNARIDDTSSLRYIMELTGGVFDQADGNCDGEQCSGARCAKGTGSDNPTAAAGQAFVAPTDGSDIVLNGAWAPGFGVINIPANCVLTAAGTTPAPVPLVPTTSPTLAPTVAPTDPLPTVSPTDPLPTTSPVPEPTAAPFALRITNGTVPPYAIVRTGTCVSHGMIDILEEDECRLVMNDGYYSTRKILFSSASFTIFPRAGDQDNNGVIDAFQDYPIPVVANLPPGCWPVRARC